MRPVTALGILLVTTSATSTASADEPPGAPPLPPVIQSAPPTVGAASANVSLATPSPPGPVWYGWQILTSDALSLGTVAASINSFQPLTILGLLGWWTGGPIIHVVHHHDVKAGVSILMRLALPAAMALLGSELASARHDPNPKGSNEVVFGAAGAVGAIVLGDSLIFGWDHPAPPEAPVRSALQVQPTVIVDFNRGLPALTVGGFF